MAVEIRAAHRSDYSRMAMVATEGDSDASTPYLDFIAEQGRLLVAADDHQVAAFGGMVPVRHDGRPPIAMVTDLFVATSVRGRGIGAALLEALLDGWPLRMTSSSKYPAALPAYRRAGLVPRWELDYLAGHAFGGGAPLQPAPWSHDRAELVDYFQGSGATVTADAVVHVRNDSAEVLRVESRDPVATVQRVLAALPEGLPVQLCVARPLPLHVWLVSHGFVSTDHDIWCATDGAELPASVSCVHAGLA